MSQHYNPLQPEERERIVAALMAGPRDVSHRRAIAAQTGRSLWTINRIDRSLPEAPPSTDSARNLEGFIPPPTRISKVVEFCRSYRKPFSFKMALANVALDAQALNVCLSRLLNKGWLTRQKMTLTKMHQGRTPIPFRAWVYTPTDLLLEGDA